MLKNGLLILCVFVFLNGIEKIVLRSDIPWSYLAVMAIPITWFLIRIVQSRTQFSSQDGKNIFESFPWPVGWLAVPILAFVFIGASGAETIIHELLGDANDGKANLGYALVIIGLFFGVGPALFSALPPPRADRAKIKIDYSGK
ncbi:MAG: hypothetical protein KF784_10210 [Fimbriimonadaceae bacterium]|nr:hypothetical protein [Fimbriimonadaceae bacterium]